MIEVNREGCTRIVFLTKRLAIKIPNINSFRMALHGLLANDQERYYGKQKWPGLCPVIFAVSFGLLIVMRRAREMTLTEWQDFDYTGFCVRDTYRIPAEFKRDSFGILDGEPVAVDYGN